MDDAALRRYVDWMELRDLSPKTIRCRTCVLGLLARHVGKPLAEATSEDLDSWQRSLAMTASARHTYLKYVGTFYAFCVAEGLVGTDPAAVLILPQLPRRLPRPIRDDDLDLAVRAAPDGSQLRVWLLLDCLAGLRCAEIAVVERDDVQDHLSEPLLLVHGKGARERAVPICQPLGWALRPFLTRPGRLFTRADGTGVATASIVSQRINDHLRGLGIPATAHQGRHWFGTVAYQESGRDLRLTQELLGHASPSTTAGYAAWDKAAAAAVVARLARRAL
jgi:site-specific recombinase XerD